MIGFLLVATNDVERHSEEPSPWRSYREKLDMCSLCMFGCSPDFLGIHSQTVQIFDGVPPFLITNLTAFLGPSFPKTSHLSGATRYQTFHHELHYILNPRQNTWTPSKSRSNQPRGWLCLGGGTSKTVFQQLVETLRLSVCGVASP